MNMTKDLFKRKSGLLFVGNMCHPPNQDAVALLYNEILREIVGYVDDDSFALHLVMSNLKNCENSNLIPLLESDPDIKIYRDISDEELLLLHQNVRLFIAPLRAGAGVKGKLNYALWSGVPIVASGLASEGMHLVDGESVLRAETSQQFATAVKFVYNNYDVWARLRQEGYKIHDKYYSAEIATKVLYETLVSINSVFARDPGYVYSHPKCRVLDQQSDRLVGREKCLDADHSALVTAPTFFRRGYFSTLLE